MMPSVVFMRDIVLAFRRGGGAYAAMSFCLVVFALFGFSLGPESLQTNAAQVLAVAVLLSCLLLLPNLFDRDYDDGTLEQYLVQPATLEWLVLAKLGAFWLTGALPQVLLAPLLAWLAGVSPEGVGALFIALLLASPTLAAIGAVGAALTLGLRKSGMAAALIVLPLFIPPLIFVAAAGSAASSILLLTGLMLAAVPLACLTCAFLLRIAYD